MTLVLNLADLPVPLVVEELNFEAIVARKKTTFQDLWTVVRAANPDLSLPDYDVSMLETDPAVLIIEADAYDELLLRARVNSAARSNLIGYSTGADLDNLAADHGVVRLAGESDAALRERIVLADQGRSTAGPEQWYEYHARSADIRVKDVQVYRKGSGPELGVAVLSTDNNGVPTADILAAVDAAINNPAVRCINDIIEVESAVKVVINVAADIWLLPETPASIVDGLPAVLANALALEGGIGFDFNLSWLLAKLHQNGVSKVELNAPAANVVMDANSAAALGTVTLTFKGRAR